MPEQPGEDYERDVVLWSILQARLLRERRFDELDRQHLIDKFIAQRPSLERYPAETLDDVYTGARLGAAAGSGIDFTLFPECSPFTIDEILDDEYLPCEPDLEGQTP